MTDTDTTTATPPDLPAGVAYLPQGEAPLLDDLGVRELRVGNAKLHGDCVHAITANTADRWDALAIVGWLWHKRQDPRALLENWTALTAGQLSEALGLAGRPADGEDVDQGDDPDDGTSGDPWTDHPDVVLATDPTAPGR